MAARRRPHAAGQRRRMPGMAGSGWRRWLDRPHGAARAGARSACSRRCRPAPRRSPDVRLTLATGGTQGVYYNLGQRAGRRLARASSASTAAPEVLSTAGLGRQPATARLRRGRRGVQPGRRGRRPARAHRPGRPAGAARARPDLRRRRARRGAAPPRRSTLGRTCAAPGCRSARPTPGVGVIAERLLDVGRAAPASDLQAVQLGINESVEALAARRDRRVLLVRRAAHPRCRPRWPEVLPIRLLDLEDADQRRCAPRYPEYAAGTVPGAELRHPGTDHHAAGAQLPAGRRGACRTTWPNALVEALFAAQEQLAAVEPGGADDRPAGRDRHPAGAAAPRRGALLPGGEGPLITPRRRATPPARRRCG